jgi:hypothetical protein
MLSLVLYQSHWFFYVFLQPTNSGFLLLGGHGRSGYLVSLPKISVIIGFIDYLTLLAGSGLHTLFIILQPGIISVQHCVRHGQATLQVHSFSGSGCPWLGFHPLMVMTLQSISLLYQFWIHTEAVQQLPAPVEFIFNTPSHHRVHHGSDLKYLDKNHAGILIIWDRIFGTFKKEEERPTYGLTKNLETNNPVRIAFVTWTQLFAKPVRSGSFKKGIGYFIHPPWLEP